MTRIALAVLALAAYGLVVVDVFLLSPWFIPLLAVPTIVILLPVSSVDT